MQGIKRQFTDNHVTNVSRRHRRLLKKYVFKVSSYQVQLSRQLSGTSAMSVSLSSKVFPYVKKVSPIRSATGLGHSRPPFQLYGNQAQGTVSLLTKFLIIICLINCKYVSIAVQE